MLVLLCVDWNKGHWSLKKGGFPPTQNEVCDDSSPGSTDEGANRRRLSFEESSGYSTAYL